MTDRESSLDVLRLRWSAISVALGSIAALVVYFVFSGDHALAKLAVAAAAVFLSKLAIFGGNLPDNPFNPWELGLIAWTIDLWVSCALLGGIRSLERLPRVGAIIDDAHHRAIQTLRQYPGIRRLAFWGVAVLVFLPIPASGAVTGTLVGQLVALSRVATLSAVAIGSGAAVLSYAAVAVYLDDRWQGMLTDPLVLVGSVLGLLLLCWWAWIKVKRELQRK